ncbi:MAG: hypothetical protein CVU73_07690 [Deltaproteobacteria bacterium HGW-Deltaproteobacteria-8]|jgi:hypothetical protein|nr:MAG: hypothetical protein CVU73_07690 [Deltaproteobacteria bacterium HGW-Deltaproteobacteria-8]
MSFASLAAQRRLAGLLGCAVMFLILASLVDGMIAGGLKDPNRLDVLPGQDFSLSEQLPRGAQSLEDVVLRATDPRLSVRLKETYSGFWLGGTIWRAEGRLAQDAPTGVYEAALYHANGTAAGPNQAFTIHAHPDQRAILAASGSVVTRTFGFSPFLLALCLLGLELVPMGASFVLSRKIGQALRQEHMAEIFRAMAAPKSSPPVPADDVADDAPPDTGDDAATHAPGGQRISFCPGAAHALAPGSLVEVLDERAKAVLGMAEVLEVSGENIVAAMQGGVQVRPGALARLVQAR